MWFWIWMAMILGNQAAAWEMVLEADGLGIIETPAQEQLSGLATSW